MAARCNFCGQDFDNSQAVRAHLKGCAAYQGRPRQAPQADAPRERSLGSGRLGGPSLGSAALSSAADPNGAFDPVRQLEQQIATEQARLKLREIQQAHDELDRREIAREREREHAAAQQAEEERRSQQARAAAERAETEIAKQHQRDAVAQQEQQKQRRQKIQDAKRDVFEGWLWDIAAAEELKAEILVAIERELAHLPVIELPGAELLQIAKGVRDRLYAQAPPSRANPLLYQVQTAVNRPCLQRLGMNYAVAQLRRVSGLTSLERRRIEGRVEADLETIQGTETNAAIEARVEEILRLEGIGWDHEGAND